MGIIDNQLNKYEAAIGKRNVGSDPSAEQMAIAKNTALGNTNSSTISRGSRAKGSWEGLTSAPSAHIQMNGTGYSAERMQTARGTRKMANLPNPGGVTVRNSVKGNMFDYTYKGSKGNSISILGKMMKLNKMF